MASSRKAPVSVAGVQPVVDGPGRTPKGAASRAHILNAAAKVFAEVGFDRARMADLIAATGMTKGAVYFYFDSKEVLAVAVLEAKHEQWLEAVQERLASLPSGLGRLRGLTVAMLELHRSHPDAWAVTRLTSSLAEVRTARPRAAALAQRWIDFVADLVGEAQAASEVRGDVDAVGLATTLVGAFDGIKATVAVLAEGPERDGRLADAGLVLEQMLLVYLAGSTGDATDFASAGARPVR